MKFLFLLGRLVFGGFFLWSGIDHLRKEKHRSLSQYAESKNVPVPKLAVAGSGVLLLLGGTSILLGIKPKLGAIAVCAFLLGVSPAMHNFWSMEKPDERATELAMFTKNIALLGAALTMMASKEPWPLSVPAESRKMKRLGRAVLRLAA